ncbi:hypothetical protein GOBAR_AA06352 [Gossypium barbadense]|uniref:Uncharacterized protein n=1 Tax=Gossypium barbadense TaxID=3634 RepID=A0A2P5YF02_GOSBA|nr:hypothetical protein GOBAR_AA06352 [Gossypium barbadense]
MEVVAENRVLVVSIESQLLVDEIHEIETKDGKHAGCESRNTPAAYMSTKTLVEVNKNNLDGESAVSTPAHGKQAVACAVPKEERKKSPMELPQIAESDKTNLGSGLKNIQKLKLLVWWRLFINDLKSKKQVLCVPQDEVPCKKPVVKVKEGNDINVHDMEVDIPWGEVRSLKDLTVESANGILELETGVVEVEDIPTGASFLHDAVPSPGHVYFVHERVAEGKPEMNYVPGEGEEQVAYILTKPLAVGAFAYLARNLESAP